MKENALTRKHIKRNLARPLCRLDEEEALVSRAQGLGPIPGTCRVGLRQNLTVLMGRPFET